MDHLSSLELWWLDDSGQKSAVIQTGGEFVGYVVTDICVADNYHTVLVSLERQGKRYLWSVIGKKLLRGSSQEPLIGVRAEFERTYTFHQPQDA